MLNELRPAPRQSVDRYWRERTRASGVAAVLNRANAASDIVAITARQQAILYPLLMRELRRSDRSVLDFGCGPGRFSVDLAVLSGGRVLAVDPVAELLAQAPRHEAVSYRVLRRGRIPAPDQSIDVAFVCLVLGGLVEDRLLDQALVELRRVLRPDGLLFLVENTSALPDTTHWAFRSESRYRDLVKVIPLRSLGAYVDRGEQISVLAGRRPLTGNSWSFPPVRTTPGGPAAVTARPSWRLRVARARHGIEAVNADLARRTIDTQRVLAAFGAKISGPGILHGPLIVHNADGDYRNLSLGTNVHLGRGVLLDLTTTLVIEDDATVSMGCTLLTHASVGDRPLQRALPEQVKPTVIGRGAYLGANVTVLAGCDIGDEAVVGAGAVVTRPVEPRTRVAGIPARPLR